MFETLPLESIQASSTNPRKRFNQQDLEDLAASITEHGVMQPIVVRPIADQPGMFEIVAGERRFRASKIAGKADIPCSVQNLDDIETLRIQIIENMQRKDLDPLEEANGLQQLITATGAHGQKPWTPEELAKKIGKSRSYVYASLNLCKLCDYAKDQLQDEKIGRETALLISRIPGEALQIDAAKTIIGSEMSFRRTKEFIKNNYTYDLGEAKWDKFDDHLIKDVPSCARCPKRTGNYPELYPDIESPDVCTDNACYRNKKITHAQVFITTAPRVIHGEDAKKIAPYGFNTYVTNGYVKSLSNIWVEGHTAQEILGDEAPSPIPFVDEFNNIDAVYNIQEIEELAASVLQEKIASGAIQPVNKEDKPKSAWDIEREERQKHVDKLNPILMTFFIDRLNQINSLLEAGDADTSTAILDYIDENCFYNEDVRDQIFNIFGHGHISEFSNIELLLALSLGNRLDDIDLSLWSLEDKTFKIQSTSALELISSLEKITGVALPPLPAAQAQELNAEESQAEAPGQTEAEVLAISPVEDPAEAVETSVNEDIAPGALPDVLPAETAGDPLPASQIGEPEAVAAPLNGFEKAKLKGEAAAAPRKAAKAKKESGQPDDDVAPAETASETESTN